MEPKKKYLSIKQWAGKAEKLRIMYNLRPGMMSAEIKYNHFFHGDEADGSRQVIYNMYFSNLKYSSHVNGTDWEDVYNEMETRIRQHVEDVAAQNAGI